MGSEDGQDNERPVHRVWVDGFRLAECQVTNQEYASFMQASGAERPPLWDDANFNHPQQPVVAISWFEAARYCEWLSGKQGAHYRLPTEAEWERAASGGLVSPRTPWGETVPAGEIPEGPLAGPWRTGCGRPNPYGLCDMGTVVHEWCADWRRPGRRASRGGSWRHAIRWSSPSASSSLPPTFRYSDYGFRPLRDLDR